ncbi:MAG: YigZ family protein [Oscillospiraceae bacterium]|nr:YigZ family protein [Oscillospiraceae bacterium]
MGYRTIKKPNNITFTERRSEFIAYLCPVHTNDEAVAFINEIKSLHRKATHNVYAYILRDNNITRYSDDGEPQGTAGVPVLDILQKNELTDICCVVTRYFGGILLGGGGLVRAYSTSAKLAVEDAEIMDMCECYRISFQVDYNLYSKVAYFLPQYEVKELSSKFEDNIFLELLVKEEHFEPLKAKLTDVSNGKIEIEESEKLFEDFS